MQRVAGEASAEAVAEAQRLLQRATDDEQDSLTLGQVGGMTARIRVPRPLGTPLSEFKDEYKDEEDGQ